VQKNLAGAGFYFDARFAIADTRTQLVLSGGSFHRDGNLCIDVARTGARVESKIRIGRDTERHSA
jgi:hypothetical protein